MKRGRSLKQILIVLLITMLIGYLAFIVPMTEYIEYTHNDKIISIGKG